MAYRDAGQRERARALLARVPPENLFQETTVIEDPWLDALHRLRTGGRVHEVRGIRHLEARRFAAAVVDFRQAMAADPGRTYSLYGLGVALDALGRDAEAEEAFRGLLAGSPLHAPTHLALAQLLAELGRPDEARAHLRHCLEIDPDSSRARLELAHLDRAAGRFTSALQGYREAARLDPARPEIRFWESVTLFLHGDSAGAVESSRRALADSGDHRLRALLARQLAATGGSDDRDEAEALARQAWRELPGASTAETVAFVLARRGRWSDAREWQEGVVAAGLEAPWMAERLAAYRRRQPPGAPWQRLEEWSDVLVAPPRDARSGG
jgi:tetratricopeptide (TPR) repeat protein